jgi:hypothetical protein
MATNKRDLKAYSRFDGTGRIVPGSTVLRRNKPKNGNWKETQAYECCDGGGCDLPPIPLTASGFTTDSIIGCSPYIRFFCNGEQSILEINTNFLCIATPGFNNMVEFYDVVALCYSWMGTWSLNGTIATLELNGNIAKQMCPDGVLTMQAFTGCPA